MPPLEQLATTRRDTLAALAVVGIVGADAARLAERPGMSGPIVRGIARRLGRHATAERVAQAVDHAAVTLCATAPRTWVERARLAGFTDEDDVGAVVAFFAFRVATTARRRGLGFALAVWADRIGRAASELRRGRGDFLAIIENKARASAAPDETLDTTFSTEGGPGICGTAGAADACAGGATWRS